ncbi:hypothetical protein [Senegalia massiliensis]|uniref:N-acetyltransferase domain-containing protein n=1 Tax=Senegalia massiliensis TaxID=1720316 RepID=A0A845QZ29_9CLOT|nr:hypothetical protein [Senegalia massiliensis]NBI06438.1 hypothetical protein [Senegalia massiliensis]
MRFIKELKRDEFENIISLFTDDFYFFTTNPDIVFYEELNSFLMLNGKTYKILDRDFQVIGLAFIKEFNLKYILYKFKIIKSDLNQSVGRLAFKEFLIFLFKKYKNIQRIETVVYGFDKYELDFYNQLGINEEIIKKKDIFKEGVFWDSYIFNLAKNKKII